jgi:hypothetical protein
MSVFDLKPLSTKTIEDLRIKSDDLWEIKIEENIYGPFETLQLKHYAKENRTILLKAVVSPMSVDIWKPFFDVREFAHGTNYTGPYWMLSQGQKSSPLSKEEITKRIELGTITRHDEISQDEGRNWHRISGHAEFEMQFTTGIALPQTPHETSFQKAKERVLEQLERKKELSDEKEDIASLTHISFVQKEKTRTLQIEDIKLLPEAPTSPSFWENITKHAMWATPVLAIAIYFAISSGKHSAELTDKMDSPLQVEKNSSQRSKKDNWKRTPASYDNDRTYDRSSITQNPSMDENYPTVIETHQEENYPDPTAEADQVAEIQDQEDKGEEHSLVQQAPNRDPAQDGESLDATMNNEPQEQPNPAVDQPVVEEVSDF